MTAYLAESIKICLSINDLGIIGELEAAPPLILLISTWSDVTLIAMCTYLPANLVWYKAYT